MPRDGPNSLRPILDRSDEPAADLLRPALEVDTSHGCDDPVTIARDKCRPHLLPMLAIHSVILSRLWIERRRQSITMRRGWIFPAGLFGNEFTTSTKGHLESQSGSQGSGSGRPGVV